MASCCIRNYPNIFIVYSHHSYVIRTEGVNDCYGQFEHMEFEPTWIGHSIKPMDKNKHKRQRIKMSSLDDW